MKSKTRKLIWSAPLVAVLAVLGALAIFAATTPDGAKAQMLEVPGPVEGLEATAKSRTSIELTWNAPMSGGAPTGYRVDYSMDNRVWTQLEDNTGSATRSYMDKMKVKADTERYYRVFAINAAGTGPVSVDPVTAFASVPVTFPAKAPGRLVLTLALDSKMPHNKINLSWTEPSDNGGSTITGYKIVEMVDNDLSSSTNARVECEASVSTTDADGDPGTPIAGSDTPAAGECLLIDMQSASDDRMAMHGNLMAGSAHYYRVSAINVINTGAPSDVKGITTRTATKPSKPTEPIAVPLSTYNTATPPAATANTIELYWLEPANNGGHALGPHMIEVKRRGRNAADTGWMSWPTSWTKFTHDGTNYSLAIGPTDSPDTYTVEASGSFPDSADVTTDSGGMVTNIGDGDAYNLIITRGPSDPTGGYQYMFRIKAKQSGEAGRNLESDWVMFNQSPRAGTGYIEVPAKMPTDPKLRIPLQPTLMAKALDAAAVMDQGIGLTWMPSDGDDDMVGTNDNGTPNDASDDFKDDGPTPADYRIDVSEDGVKWMMGQTRTVSLRKWDHEGLKSMDVRYYRLFPINGGQFGQAYVAGARAKAAVVASPDQALNLRQTGKTTTSITMSWNSVSAAEKYNLYYAMADENDIMTGGWMSLKMGLTGTSYTDSKSLIPGASRWYRLVAMGDNDMAVPGADGAEALGMTDEAGEPGMPVGLVAQQAFDTSLTGNDERGVLLLWAQPTDMGKDPTTSYMVQRIVDDGEWETLAEDTADLDDQTPLSTHYHDESEPAENEERAYRVAARSGSGAGAWSNTSYHPAMKGADTLTEPTNVMAMSDMAGELSMTWEGAANADLYVLIAVDLDPISWETAVITDGAARSGTVPGLTSGKRYLGIVVATKGTGADLQVLYETAAIVTVQ